MIHLRPVIMPDDLPALHQLQTAFTTDRIYRVQRSPDGFALVEEPVSPPLTKGYHSYLEDLEEMEFKVVATEGDRVVGLAAASFAPWNGRAVLWHLYVSPARRGAGIGRLLLAEVERYARAKGAWCLCLETQNVNYPAIQFYRRMGFELTGIDTALYHPAGEGAGETAIFMSRRIDA